MAVAGALSLGAPAPSVENAGTVPGPGRAAPVPSSSPAAPAAPPVALTVPGRFTAPVEAVAVDADGALRLPESPHRLGWWALGGTPGSGRGTVLLAGHVDVRDGGPGVFAALRAVPVGAHAEVATADGGRHRYVITARRVHRKEALPRDLFGAEGTARLALVTCTGRWRPETGGYEENLVLYGVPVTAAPRAEAPRHGRPVR
ncbi:class F sortase [Streptomyces macrosporus]|uniref:class F sortase n=1 Tax=Streptomyces macrosporus TaxID=44032 RepID=UPI0031DC6A47